MELKWKKTNKLNYVFANGDNIKYEIQKSDIGRWVLFLNGRKNTGYNSKDDAKDAAQIIEDVDSME